MKSLHALSKKLNNLGLSYVRKADLISKYICAGPELTRQMNVYFGIKNPVSPVRKKPKAAPMPKKKTIKRKKQTKKIKKSSGPYSETNKQTYRGSNASLFDHRARPTPDLHLDADKLLDKEYFKNS